MVVRSLQFAAIVLSALALVPSGAHLAALPNKIDLAQTDYFIVQNVYSGWAMFGAVWFAALAANVALAIGVRAEPAPFRLATGAALCFVAMFAIFFMWTLPANQATANWTALPEHWRTLRRDWEFSHAVNAVIAFCALCLCVLSTTMWRRPAGKGTQAT